MRQLFLSILLSLSVSLPCWASASRDWPGVGGSDALTCGSATALDKIHQGTMSAALWFYADAKTDLMRFINKGSDGATSGWLILYNASSAGVTDAINFSVRWSLAEASWKFGALQTGAWYHLAITYDGTSSTNEAIMYLNGVPQSLTNDPEPSGTNTTDDSALSFIIGNRETTQNRAFNGKLAYIHLYNRILTPVEVFDVMYHPGSITSGLLGYWPIWGDATEIDVSGNANSCSVSGTATSDFGPPIILTSPQSWRHWFDRVLDWLVPSVFADDIVVCNPLDPTVLGRVVSYQRSADPFKAGATTNPNSLIWSLPPSPVNPWDGIVPAVSQSYWKCSGNTVVAMSQAEQDAINAPAVAEAARQQIFADEINGTTGNDICHADLADITTKVNAWLAARQGELDVATTNAQVKASLRDQFYPAIAQAFLKVMKCVRAVQR